MGSQINFYMMESDLAAVEAFLRQRVDDFCIVVDRVKEGQQNVFDTIIDAIKSHMPCFKVFLIQRRALAQIKFETKGGYHWVDSCYFVPGVEFSICVLKDLELRRGRFYFHETYNVRDRNVSAPDDFKKWARALCNWVRRKAKRVDGIRDGLVFPSVLEWIGTSDIQDGYDSIKKISRKVEK